MGDLVIEREIQYYKVYEYQGRYYVDGTCLNLMGYSKASNSEEIEWEFTRLFPITEKQIEKAKTINVNCEYIPQFLDLEDTKIRKIRSFDDLMKFRQLDLKDQEMLNRYKKQISAHIDYMDDGDLAELKIKALKDVDSSNFFKREVCNITLDAVYEHEKKYSDNMKR